MITLILFLSLRIGFAHANPWSVEAYAPRACQTELMSDAHRKEFEVGVRVDGVVVSGEMENPTQTILTDLRIDSAMIADWRHRRVRVLSVGEGMSGLVPYLRLRAVDAIGVDLWYGGELEIPDNRDGRRMKSHLNLYSRYLEVGDVRDLKYANNSVDVMLSYKLFNNLDPREFADGHEEMLRVLKRGGEAFTYVLPDAEDEANFARFCAINADFLSACRYENGTAYFQKALTPKYY